MRLAKRKRKPNHKAMLVPAEYGTETGETRGADALTVAWLITALAASLAEMLAAAAWVFFPETGGESKTAVMTYLVTFIALITASLALVLTPLVLMLRRVPPPRAATAGVITIGFLPWCVVVIVWLRGYAM